MTAEATVKHIAKTDAILGGHPVYHYRVEFRTLDGQWIEGETWQAVRPWLENNRLVGDTENVLYSATDYHDFVFEKR